MGIDGLTGKGRGNLGRFVFMIFLAGLVDGRAAMVRPWAAVLAGN